MKLDINTNISEKELYEFTLNHNYKSLAGIIGLFFSIASAVGAVLFWDKLSTMNRVLIILFALMFTVFEPVGCYFKVKKQIKKSFEKPLSYVFDKKGITVSQGDAKADLTWQEIMKVVSTRNLINIYTSPVRAFIIPKKAVGGHMGELKEMIEENAQCRKVMIK